MNSLKLVSKSQDCQEVFYENGVHLGDFVINDDGYWVFFPELKGGYWDEYILQLLADKLKEINEPWDKEIQAYFASER